MTAHVIFILFLFALGASVGSFLNVVVWRLPRVEPVEGEGVLAGLLHSCRALTFPGSRCPQCQHELAWKDNIPVLGWVFLGGKCRYCKSSIPARYPVVELFTGLLFVGLYVSFFILQVGPCAQVGQEIIDEFGIVRGSSTVLTIQHHWPIFALYLFAVSALLAASLIDAELFIIPLEICWLMAAVGILAHTLMDSPTMPGSIGVEPIAGALALGATVGLVISIVLLQRKIIPRSFPDGGPMLDVERQAVEQEQAAARASGATSDHETPPPPLSRREIRREMSREMVFLTIPLLLGALAMLVMVRSPALLARWESLLDPHWTRGLLGSLLGALVGGFVVWLTRILGSLAFGREAMGLGDVHLMFGVGAIIGGAGATIAFFIAPFFGLLFAMYKFLSRRQRELPYGPFLAMATLAVMIFYCSIYPPLANGLQGVILVLRNKLGL